MKKTLALLLTIAMVLALLAGCGGSAQSAGGSQTEPAASAAEEAPAGEPEEEIAEEPAEAAEDSAAASVELEEETNLPVGEVIDAETCKANGYDVEHGMYDWETYVELPLVDEPTSFTYWMSIQPFMMAYNNFDIQDVTYFKELENRTGIHLDITGVSAFVASEQFSLMIASGDYTDILEGGGMNTSGGSAQLLEDEVIIDLLPYEDLMPNYMAWLKADPTVYYSALTYDGALTDACEFEFHGRERNVGPQLRGDWMEALGLERPVTYDDYHDVLTAMKNEYGATLWVNTSGTARDGALSAGYDTFFNSQDSNGLIYVGDQVVYCPVTEDYRDFLRLMNQWWNEGLIYSDFASQSSDANPDSNLIANGKISMWVGDSNNMANWDQLTDEIEIMPGPFPVKYEGQTYKLFSTATGAGGGTEISTACDDPELVCQWFDYLYTYEGHLLSCYGVEGEGLEFDENGEPRYTDLVLHNPEMIVVACSVMYSSYGGAGIRDSLRFSPGYSEKQLDAIALWTDHLGDGEYTISGSLKMTTDETSEYARLMTEVDTYAESCGLQFLTGTMSLETDWDGYLAHLEELGLSDLMAVCQAPYDRYLEAMAELEAE